MKNKIKEALRQEYKGRLELTDEMLDGVAAFASTYVTEEGKIEEFVKNAATLAMLKSYQSLLDKDRERRKNGEQQGQPGSEKPGDTTPPAPAPTLDAAQLAELVKTNVEAIVKPFADKLTALEAERAVNATVAEVGTRIDAWGYGKGYPREMEKARRNAMELYEAFGKTWTADQLEAKIKEKFNQEVEGRGLDTTQPFKSEGPGVNQEESNRAFAEEIRRALGMPEEGK